MRDFSFHSTRVFISKEQHTKNFANAKIYDFLQFFSPYLLQMAEAKKMLRVKIVFLEVLYHP